MSRGHRLEDIKRYTLDQIGAFSAAASRNRSRELCELAVTTRVAFHADGRDWKKYIDSLVKDSEPKKKKAKGLSPAQVSRLRSLLSKGRA